MSASRIAMVAASAGAFLCLSLVRAAPQQPPTQGEPKAQVVREQKPQPRPHGQPVAVDPA